MPRKLKAASPALSPQLRRSSRPIPSKANYVEKMTEDEGDSTSPWDGAMHTPPREKTRHTMDIDSNGVERAVRGLKRTEDHFRRATKRQKLKVEESSLHAMMEDSVDEGSALKSRTTRAADVLPKDRKTVSRKSGSAPDLDRMAGDNGGTNGTTGDFYRPGNDEADDGTGGTSDSQERGAARPPAVNSSYLPLPWKGRLGYACLNTYLRSAKPTVFCSRTCRMASIVDHRHPLKDPSQPEHPIKNRPDKAQRPDVALGQKYVQELGLANAKDIVKMLRWNDKYGIKFMRLSSEMFPFASHPEQGYYLVNFASEVLAEAGSVAAELGHRLTMHPGQFTQLGSPRQEVIASSVRDLIYQDELLSLLKLPEQQDRDAVLILHMGGVFGDKRATLDRFRTNYTDLLSPSIKARLVLENDDVAWTVHDLLPICEELNIPLVLDFHHHNIMFDATQVREGTLDISAPEIMDRILATWRRKGITPKMHYSEQCAGTVTPRDRRKHSPRVLTLPPCPPDMDLMIEAKDKEQAVFELMRTFKLPGFEKINDMIPHERQDEDQPPAKVIKSKDGSGKRKKNVHPTTGDIEDSVVQVDVENDPENMGRLVSADEFAMGGPQNRVYWPVGMEHWLKPKKKETNKLKVGGEEAV